MWVIRLIDGTPGIMYLCEYLLDGRILVFETEESALRFMRSVLSQIQQNLGINMRTVKFDSDPRKFQFAKVSMSRMEQNLQTIRDCCGVIL